MVVVGVARVVVAHRHVGDERDGGDVLVEGVVFPPLTTSDSAEVLRAGVRSACGALSVQLLLVKDNGPTTEAHANGSPNG